MTAFSHSSWLLPVYVESKNSVEQQILAILAILIRQHAQQKPNVDTGRRTFTQLNINFQVAMALT